MTHQKAIFGLFTAIYTLAILSLPAIGEDTTSSGPLMPEAIAGPWYSKFVVGQESPQTCGDRKTFLNGIRLSMEGKLTAINGSYSCEIEELTFDDPANYGSPDVLGVWWYQAACKLHYQPSSLNDQKSEWKEYGTFRVIERDVLELTVSASDRETSFFSKDRGEQSWMTYLQCK